MATDEEEQPGGRRAWLRYSAWGGSREKENEDKCQMSLRNVPKSLNSIVPSPYSSSLQFHFFWKEKSNCGTGPNKPGADMDV